AGVDEGVRCIGGHSGEVAQVVLRERIAGRPRQRQDAESLFVGQEWHGDERAWLMFWIGRFEASVGPAIAYEDWLAMRQRPAGDAFAHFEARHFTDRDRAVARRFHLELFL